MHGCVRKQETWPVQVVHQGFCGTSGPPALGWSSHFVQGLDTLGLLFLRFLPFFALSPLWPLPGADNSADHHTTQDTACTPLARHKTQGERGQIQFCISLLQPKTSPVNE